MILLTKLLTVVCFGAGAYRTLKVLKDGEVDFELLVFFCVVGAVEVFASYFEWMVSWVPFYSIAKSGLLVLILIPRLRVPRLIFHTHIIPLMTLAHKELPRGLLLIQSLPSTLLFSLVDLFMPGVFSSVDESSLESPDLDPDFDDKKYVSHRMSADEVAQIKEIARNKRTMRDLATLNRRHHVSERHLLDIAREESKGRSPSASPTVSPLSSSMRSPLKPPRPPDRIPPPLDLDNPSLSPFKDPAATYSPPPAMLPHKPSYLGGLARKVLTGSREVSIRDHLFDLTLPPPARPEERSESTSRSINPHKMRPLHAPKKRYSSGSPRSAFHLLPPEAKCDDRARRTGNSNDLKQRPRLVRSRGSAECLREGFFASDDNVNHSKQSTPVYTHPNLIRRKNADVAL